MGKTPYFLQQLLAAGRFEPFFALSVVCIGGVLLLAGAATLRSGQSADGGSRSRPAAPNVLFIAVDDLRPELGAYGHADIHSPHIDRLAAEGVLMERAFANVPVCGASRASLLTGLYPTRSRFVEYDTRADEDAPGAVTLPQHFKRHGYHTASLGKVFHHLDDSPESWSEVPWHPNGDPALARPTWRDYRLPEHIRMDTTGERRGPPYERARVPDSAYYDGLIARRAVRGLQRLGEQDQPFFLAVGFLKPHLPFNAPQRYWDLYPPEAVERADNRALPQHAPAAAWHPSGELRAYAGVPAAGPLPDSMARRMVRGYHAATSYVDAQIGKVLEALDRLGLTENTVVVLWGDHGWSLGEHGLWCKHSTFERALHAPLILRAPGLEGGHAIDDLVGFVDLYPTLTELAGLPRPPHLAGRSFAGRLRAPAEATGRRPVLSRWYDGQSLRTDRYRYTAWRKGDSTYARMLYDHRRDPRETINTAGHDTSATLVDRLHLLLQQQAQSAR